MPGLFRTGLVALSVMTIHSFTAHAGELRLNNGDLLHGKLTAINQDALSWKSDLYGVIQVPKASVMSLNSEAPANLRLADNEILANCTLSVSMPASRVTCADTHSADAQFSAVTETPPPTKFKGKIIGEFSKESGNTQSEEIEFDARLEIETPGWRHAIEAEVELEQKSERTTDENYDLDYQLDWLYADHWYTFTRLEYFKDRFGPINEWAMLVLGFGHVLWTNPNGEVVAELGPGYARLQFEEEDKLARAAGSWRLDARIKLDFRNIELFHRHEFLWQLDKFELNRLETETGATIPLIWNLVGEIRLDYDRSGNASGDTEKEDYEWVLGLGYKW